MVPSPCCKSAGSVSSSVKLRSTSRGDACHPMLPYLAMGANSALEDGAALGRLLGYVTSRENVPLALDLYQKIRKQRGEAIARETFKQVTASVFLPCGVLSY